METLNLECEAYTSQLLDTTYIWRHNGLRIEVDNTNYLRRLAYEQVRLLSFLYLVIDLANFSH